MQQFLHVHMTNQQLSKMYINMQINDLDNFLKRVRMTRLSDTDDGKQREIDFINMTHILLMEEKKHYHFCIVC